MLCKQAYQLCLRIAVALAILLVAARFLHDCAAKHCVRSAATPLQFGTRFEEMDALSGRHQTTHGIWLARSTKVAAPTTLVMDLEGSDGRERGEDDTSFERQSALFALAVADIVLVNMWAKDVGRESGAGKPLLKTIFQVNLKLFQVRASNSPEWVCGQMALRRATRVECFVQG